jgi:hypothetical protein
VNTDKAAWVLSLAGAGILTAIVHLAMGYWMIRAWFDALADMQKTRHAPRFQSAFSGRRQWEILLSPPKTDLTELAARAISSFRQPVLLLTMARLLQLTGATVALRQVIP